MGDTLVARLPANWICGSAVIVLQHGHHATLHFRPGGSGAGDRRSISPKPQSEGHGLETFPVKPRRLFLKVHTNAGVIGYGEPITEGRALTCAEAVKEIETYLIGIMTGGIRKATMPRMVLS